MQDALSQSRRSVYLLHFGVDPLTHLRPTMSHQDRAVLVDVDQSCSLLNDIISLAMSTSYVAN